MLFCFAVEESAGGGASTCVLWSVSSRVTEQRNSSVSSYYTSRRVGLLRILCYGLNSLLFAHISSHLTMPAFRAALPPAVIYMAPLVTSHQCIGRHSSSHPKERLKSSIHFV
jgi:hypothetical protein